MLTDAHSGEGGVKNGRKYAHVINGRPLLMQHGKRKCQERSLVKVSFWYFTRQEAATLLSSVELSLCGAQR